jgi:hypothetical protein
VLVRGLLVGMKNKMMMAMKTTLQMSKLKRFNSSICKALPKQRREEMIGIG